MKAWFELHDPDEVEATLTVRMKIKTWKELKAQLSESYPSWEFGHHIRDLVSQAEKQFRVTDE